jgi:hypothetical protein
MRTPRQIAAIAWTTFLEAIQQPIAFLLALSSVAMTLFVPVFQFHRFGEEGRLARDSGLSCMLIFGMALAVGTAGRAVAGEIASGTAASVIGKPVARSVFVISKWLGCMLVTALFWVGQTAAVLIAERVSAHTVVKEEFTGALLDPYTFTLAVGGVALALAAGAALHFFWRRRFGVTVFFGIAASQLAAAAACGFYDRLGEGVPYSPGLNAQALPAALLVLAALAVFAALATALSTRLQPPAVFAVCAGVLLAGLAGDTLFADAPAVSARGLLGGVLPDLQNFWLCDAIAHGGRISARYLLSAGGYALTCCALFLLGGCMAFKGKDLG